VDPAVAGSSPVGHPDEIIEECVGTGAPVSGPRTFANTLAEHAAYGLKAIAERTPGALRTVVELLERVVDDDEPATKKSPTIHEDITDVSTGADDSEVGALRDQLREARSLAIQLAHELDSANVALAEARTEAWRAQALITASRGASEGTRRGR
jgi:hypothetical protein